MFLIPKMWDESVFGPPQIEKYILVHQISKNAFLVPEAR